MNPHPPVTSTRMNVPLLEINGQLAKARQPPIPFRNDRHGRAYRPWNSQVFIGPMNPPFMLGGIDVVHLIKDYAVWLQRAKPVRKPPRHQELVAGVRTQLDGQVLPVAA